MTHKEKVEAIISHFGDKVPFLFDRGKEPAVMIGKKRMEIIGVERHGKLYRALLEGRTSVALMASEAVCDALNSQLKLWHKTK